MKHSLTYGMSNALHSAKILAGVMLLSGAMLAHNSAGAKADEIDLTAVTASISAALDEVAAESRVDNQFVLPLRTNAELADISAMCEFVLSMPDVDAGSIPSICGEPETEIDNEVPFAGGFDSEFGYQYSHYLTDGDDVEMPSFLLVRDDAMEHYFTGG